MAHTHSHSHGGGLKNTPLRVLYICLVINLLFVVAEALAGWQSNSTGLLSDAGHNLGDALGLLLSLIAIYLGRSKGNISKSVSKYITLANGLLLLGAVALIVFESVGKIINPHEVNAHTVQWHTKCRHITHRQTISEEDGIMQKKPLQRNVAGALNSIREITMLFS